MLEKLRFAELELVPSVAQHERSSEVSQEGKLEISEWDFLKMGFAPLEVNGTAILSGGVESYFEKLRPGPLG